MAGATVTVASPSTGLTRVVQTSSSGSYTVPALPVGTYTVRITATGFETFTALHNPLAKFGISNSFSVVDNASFIFGRHALKAGVKVRKVEINQSAGSNDDLCIAFANKADFANNVVQTVTLNAALPTTGLRRLEEYGYIQDQYKLRSNITVTGGLRYEFYSNFHEVPGRGVVFDPRSCPPGGFCPAGSAFSFPYLLNIEPRLAASWSPFSDGQTVVTAGYGIYAGDGQLGDLNAPVNNLATREQLTGKGLSFPVDELLKNGLSSSQTPRGLARQRASQQIQAWSANVQQTVSRDTVLQLSYLGTKGTHLFTRTYLNGINPQTGTRPIPSLGLIDYKDTESNSNFHALNAVLRHDFHSGIFFAVNYQWSHSINDGSIGGGETLAAQNVNCRACDRAASDQDIRHYFTASKPVPFMSCRSGARQGVSWGYEWTRGQTRQWVAVERPWHGTHGQPAKYSGQPQNQ